MTSYRCEMLVYLKNTKIQEFNLFLIKGFNTGDMQNNISKKNFKLLEYLSFNLFPQHTWCMLLRKRVVRAKLDIYVCTTCGFEENNLRSSPWIALTKSSTHRQKQRIFLFYTLVWGR
jgi:hypothetical protein